MKVAVCSLHINDWYYEIVKYGIETIKNYAKKHNYDFYACNEVYDGKRECPWYKIKAIEKILPEYDYIIWIDADGFVTMPEWDIHFFLQLMGKKDMLCTRDWNNTLNTGIMVMKNTPFIHTLLYSVWNNTEKFDSAFHEQASMGQIYESNRLNSKNYIEILPLEKSNILYTYWSNYKYKGQFFMHVARCAHDRVGFIYTMDFYCPLKMAEDKEGEYEERVEWLKNEGMYKSSIKRMLDGGPRERKSTRCLQYELKNGW